MSNGIKGASPRIRLSITLEDHVIKEIRDSKKVLNLSGLINELLKLYIKKKLTRPKRKM